MSLDPAYRFALLVIGAAIAVAVLAATRGVVVVGDLTPALVVLMLLVLVGELVPITLPTQHDDGRISASSAFALAVLVVDCTAAAAIAYVGASLIRDLGARMPAIKTGFNAANVLLATAAAGFVLHAVGGVAGAAAAGIVLWSVNNALTIVVTSLAMTKPIARTVRDARQGMAFDLAMIAFAPVIVIVATHSWPALLLLLIPIAALVHSAREVDHRRHDALHDALTGLPNRVLLHRLLDQELARMGRGGDTCALLVLDLDRFKDVNDTLGHRHGDTLLRGVAQRLRALLRTEDTVARLAGDEFALLLAGPVGEAGAIAVADRIRAALAEPIAVGGLRVVTGVSVGIALSAPGDVGDGILRRADVAMYRAKEQGAPFSLYEPSVDPYTAERLELAAELRDGIARDELVLHFQPKVTPDVRRVAGFEALVRWQHPLRGLLGPGEFLPLAEQSDLMQPLTDWVLEAALGQVAEWRRTDPSLHVAVNLSPQTLRDEGLADDVLAALARHALPAEALQLEITESSLMRDPQRAAEVLEELGRHGVRIAIDDFGTGWSSLMWLKRLPVQSIKVDRSFVGDMIDSPSDAAIVESTIRLGQTLGLDVVAEGVETEETLERLREYGCHAVQGYLIARPQPADELTAWLRGTPASPAVV